MLASATIWKFYFIRMENWNVKVTNTDMMYVSLKSADCFLGARNPKNNWHNYFYYSVIDKVSNTKGNEARWSQKKKKIVVE